MSNIDWVTLGINAAISMFLSLILFALGLRAGKERTDRKEIREKYRNIYSYLKKFKDRIEEGKPLYWRNFVKSFHDSFTPYLKEMVNKGEHVELNKGIISHVLEIEKDCLSYGWSFHNLSLKAGEIVEEILVKNQVSLKKGNYDLKTNIIDTENGGSFFEYNPASLLQEKEFNYVLNRLLNSEVGVNFRYIQESKIMYQIHIRQADLKCIDIRHILNQVRNSLVEYKDRDQYLSNEDRIIKELSKHLKILEKKIKEPFSFWNTIGNAIIDFFR